MNVKAIVKSAVTYLEDNPGVATLVGGYVVLGAAKLGLHVTLSELYAVAAVLIPLIAGGHLVARKGREKRAAKPAALGGQAEVR